MWVQNEFQSNEEGVESKLHSSIWQECGFGDGGGPKVDHISFWLS